MPMACRDSHEAGVSFALGELRERGQSVKVIVPGDVIPYQEYERQREVFRANIITLKQRRRMAVGPCITMVFENRATVQFQIQEMIRVERIFERANVRDTFYSEVLDVIASYEAGFADVLVQNCKTKRRKLTSWEVDDLFVTFERQAHWKPLIEKVRNKMASRDLAFRDALHLQLQEYVTPLQRDEFERFLGEKSKELAERLEEAKDVMKRLKERE
ncbi:MAG: DUF3501 family protein [Nitrospira sp.]|nr:DUF3501 family protein [Nitrospira sp.]